MKIIMTAQVFLLKYSASEVYTVTLLRTMD